jgi:hypothetical protein
MAIGVRQQESDSATAKCTAWKRFFFEKEKQKTFDNQVRAGFWASYGIRGPKV